MEEEKIKTTLVSQQNNESTILIESKKISQRKKVIRNLIILFSILLVIFIASIVSVSSQYKNYTEVQNAAVQVYEDNESLYGKRSDGPDLSDKTQKEKVTLLYNYFTKETSPYLSKDLTKKYNEIIKNRQEYDKILGDTLEDAGYHSYDGSGIYKISSYLKYTSFSSYYFSTTWIGMDHDDVTMAFNNLIFYETILQIITLIYIVYVIYLISIKKKRIVVKSNFVECYNNNGSIKSIPIKDLTSVEVIKKNGIVLKGNNIKYTLKYISNAEEIKSQLLILINENNFVNVSNQQIDVANEIKKFKDLLDNGSITQEEFDEKKKELLGL